MTRKRSKNPLVLSEIVLSVEGLISRRREATFNSLAQELKQKKVLAFRKSLREYMDLLLFSGVLGVRFEKTAQPNIRKKQLYSVKQRNPLVEVGVPALIFHGLNWDVPRPKSLKARTDFEGLALSEVVNRTVYASLEDSIVELLAKVKQNDELLVFLTALLATKKIDVNYILRRARAKGKVKTRILCALLLAIEDTLTSPKPHVEDIETLYKLRETYSKLKRPSMRTIMPVDESTQKLSSQLLTQEEIVEYAGKQLGIRG